MKWTQPYIGVPYLWGGRDMEGWDCWGMVRYVMHAERGIELPLYDEIRRDELERREVACLIAHESIEWKRVADPEPFAVAVFRLLGFPCHIGLVVDRNAFMHVRRGANTVIERLSNLGWKKRVDGFYVRS